jgi:hypothetical protein
MTKNSKRDKIPTGAVLSKEGGRVDSNLLFLKKGGRFKYVHK